MLSGGSYPVTINKPDVRTTIVCATLHCLEYNIYDRCKPYLVAINKPGARSAIMTWHRTDCGVVLVSDDRSPNGEAEDRVQRGQMGSSNPTIL